LDLLQAIFRPRVHGLWLWLGLGLWLVLIGSGFRWQTENSAWRVYLFFPQTENSTKLHCYTRGMHCIIIIIIIFIGVGVIGWAELIAELICDTVLNG